MSKDWPVNQDICLSTFLFGLVHRPQRLHQSACQSQTPLSPHLRTRPQDTWTPPTEAGPHHKVVPGELRLLIRIRILLLILLVILMGSVNTLKMSVRLSATVWLWITDSNRINIQSGQEFFHYIVVHKHYSFLMYMFAKKNSLCAALPHFLFHLLCELLIQNILEKSRPCLRMKGHVVWTLPSLTSRIVWTPHRP